jgi:hypothetical protein
MDLMKVSSISMLLEYEETGMVVRDKKVLVFEVDKVQLAGAFALYRYEMRQDAGTREAA